jgi:hypothetical protein
MTLAQKPGKQGLWKFPEFCKAGTYYDYFNLMFMKIMRFCLLVAWVVLIASSSSHIYAQCGGGNGGNGSGSGSGAGAGAGSSGGSGATGVTGTQDPNNLTGPGGYGVSGFVTSSGTFAYRIDFENMTNASAPVQQAIINNQLGTNFDWTMFNVTEIGFGDHLIALPPGTSYYAANVTVSYLGTNFQVQIQVGIQPNSGLVYANFHSIDPNTSLPPPVNIGFLPPEDGTGRGQGHISYTIRARSGLPTGTQLRNVALISFDNQPAIATDQVDDFNPAAGIDPSRQALITLDAIAPTSHVNSLPSQSQLLQVPLSWAGQDDPGGSGVASFDIYVSDNGGAGRSGSPPQPAPTRRSKANRSTPTASRAWRVTTPATSRRNMRAPTPAR